MEQVQVVAGRGRPNMLPQVRATFEAIGYGRSRLMGKLSPHGEVLSFCHEASTCGYGVYREIIATGHHCAMVAPSLIPRKPGG